MKSPHRAVNACRKRFRKWRLRTAVRTLKPATRTKRGHALLAYRIEPFLFGERRSLLFSHTMYMETVLISDILRKFGFEVDVIGFTNNTFVPKKKYDLLISSRDHFQRYAELTGRDCLKIAHLDTAHWKYNNAAGHARCLEVNARRPGVLDSYRKFNPNRAMEYADLALVLGNEFTIGTYETFGKPVYRIPLPGLRLFPKPDKDFGRIRRNFLWFGSQGLVHKGLDIALEAFAQMPEYTLTVCGPIEQEREGFVKAYEQELFHTKNIRTLGWIDIMGPDYSRLANENLAMIHPSCAEGGGGAVVNCMHAGLIPVVSWQSSVDVGKDWGLYVRELSVDAVKEAVRELVASSPSTLAGMAYRSWAYARKHHTEENYRKRMEAILSELLEGKGGGETADSEEE